MPKIPESSKMQQKERIVTVLVCNPDGLTSNELLEILNYDEIRTLNKHLEELQVEGKTYKDGMLHFAYPPIRPRRLAPAPEEAVILYLATRLFVKQSDKRNELAETLLFKLAEILSQDLKLG